MTFPRRHRHLFLLAAALLLVLGLLVMAPPFQPSGRSARSAAPPPATAATTAPAAASLPVAASPARPPPPPLPASRTTSAGASTANPARQHFRLINATPTEARFSFELGDYQSTAVTRPDGKFARITAGDAWITQCPGAPALPVFQTDLLLPHGRTATLEIVQADYEDIPTLPVVPSAGPARRQQPPADCPPDPAIYQTDRPYPVTAAELGPRYRLRRATGAAAIISPIQYFPQRNLLRVFRRLELVLRADLATAEDYPTSDQEWNFQILQTSRFLNADLLRGNPNPDDGIGAIRLDRRDRRLHRLEAKPRLCRRRRLLPRGHRRRGGGPARLHRRSLPAARLDPRHLLRRP